MTSNDVSTIEAITYLSNNSAKNNNRSSHLEMLQHQQQFHVPTSSPSCEHECNCMHHHHSNGNGGSSNFASTNVSNGPYAHHHNHFNHLNQHMHLNTNSYISQQKQHHQDSNLIYNNSSSSECNQATNENSQNGCTGTVIHYVPTSNLSALNIIPSSCECVVGHIQHHHHQRQSSTEQSQSIQSGRSSRIISCDENNPSETEDGMSNLGMIITTTSSNGCRLTSKRLL